MTFGKLLKKLRKRKNIGIKKLAPTLKVDYSYLSKLENDRALPSKKTIRKVAKYFSYSEDDLLIKANKIPKDIIKIIQENPKEALLYLRKKFRRRKQE